jgi:hypothetical protein
MWFGVARQANDVTCQNDPKFGPKSYLKIKTEEELNREQNNLTAMDFFIQKNRFLFDKIPISSKKSKI